MKPKMVEHKYTEKYYKYQCYKCNYWEWAPADVVEEFADMDEHCEEEYSLEQEGKRNGMPVMVCPNCDSDFYYSGEKKVEEGSYLVDENEPFPF